MKTKCLPLYGDCPVSNMIGFILRQLREAQSLTQAEVAKKAGLSLMALHFIETRQRCPKIDTVERIAISLKSKLKWVVDKADEYL